MDEVNTDEKKYKRWKDISGLVHRDVTKKGIVRELRSPQIVSHNDGNKSNFKTGNVSVTSRSFHSSLEARRKRNKKW